MRGEAFAVGALREKVRSGRAFVYGERGLFGRTADEEKGSDMTDRSTFRIPGEFEHQEACLLSWPQFPYVMKGQNYELVFAHIVKNLVNATQVVVNCVSQDLLDHCKEVLVSEGVDVGRIRFTMYPDGSSWCRDYGPDIMVDDEGRVQLANFRFNMYGQDDENSEVAFKCGNYAAHLALEFGCKHIVNSTLVSEGGDKEFNGQGVMIALRDTEWSKRNADRTLEEVEGDFKATCNLKKIIWLDKGVYDDELTTSGVLDVVDGENVFRSSSANGHIDEMCRFVDAHTILLAEVSEAEAEELNSARISKERLDACYEVLKNATDAQGIPFRIVRMPVPVPFYVTSHPGDWIHDTWSHRYLDDKDELDDGTPMPRGPMKMQPALSYCNFLIMNDVVLAQSYWKEGLSEKIKERDSQAMEILKSVFPDRRVIAIDTTALNIRGGGIHCATKQIPLFGKAGR